MELSIRDKRFKLIMLVVGFSSALLLGSPLLITIILVLFVFSILVSRGVEDD